MNTAKISETLRTLGIAPKLSGYHYIRCAIELAIEDMSIMCNRVTKELYPKIAKKYNSIPTRVERCIRHAIEVSVCRGDMDLLEKIFGYTINADKGKPTNSEFIAAVADYLITNAGTES